MTEQQCNNKLAAYDSSNKLTNLRSSITTLPSKSEEESPPLIKLSKNLNLRPSQNVMSKDNNSIYNRVDSWLNDLEVSLAEPEDSQYSYFEAQKAATFKKQKSLVRSPPNKLSLGTPNQKISLIQRRRQFSGGKGFTLFKSNCDNSQVALGDAKRSDGPVTQTMHPLQLSKSTPHYHQKNEEEIVTENKNKNENQRS